MTTHTKPVLTQENARRAAQAAIDHADKRSLKEAIAIVDDGGHLMYFERTDGTSWGSGEVALSKAVSAAAYGRGTHVFDERLASGRLAVLAQPRAFPIQGGVPFLKDGLCIGAIGASGALAAEDTELCEAAAAAIASAEVDRA